MADQKTLELQIKILAQQALAQVEAVSGDLKSLAAQARSFEGDSKGIANALKQYEGEAAKAAASMKLFGASSAELRQAQTQLKNAAVELVTKGFDPQSAEVKKLVEDYKRLEKEAGELDGANGKNTKSFGDLKGAIMNTAEAAAALKALSVIKDMGAFAMETADKFQTARSQFGILLGDMKAGAGLFNEIKAFNDVTPFDLDTLTQATNVLISAKVPLKDLQSQLTKFGDLSQGNSQKMTSYVNAFSQAAAKGKADMQVLNTYLHQGVPILDALAKGFGVTAAEVTEMASQGKISFEDFSKALDDLTAKGGQFYGGMELSSKSLAAMQEGLREATNSLAASFGDMLLPAGVGAVGMLTDLVNAVNESAGAKTLLAVGITAVTGLMAAMAVKAAALAAKTWLAQAAQMGFNAAAAVTNPLLWAGIAAAAAATAVYMAYATSMQKADKAAETLAYQQRKQRDGFNDTGGAAAAATAAINGYAESLRGLSEVEFDAAIIQLRREITEARKEYEDLRALMLDAGDAEDWDWADRYEADAADALESLRLLERELAAVRDQIGGRRTSWIDSMFGGTDAGRIQKINEQLAKARGLLAEAAPNSAEWSKLQTIIGKLNKDLEGAGARAADIGTAWRDKMLEGVAAVNREQERSLEELNAKAAEAYGRNYAAQAAYIAELAALNAYYDKKRGDALKKSYGEIGTEWRDAMLAPGEKLAKQFGDALRELAKKYNESAGADADYAEYGKEREALVAWEAKERGDMERRLVLEAHGLRMENYREEWEYRRELARRDGNYGQFAGAEVMAQTAGTDMGQLAAGVDPVSSFISALANAALELENVQKALNFTGTLVEGIMSVIGPLIDGAFADVAGVLTEIGETAGQVLAPVIGIVSVALKALAGILKIASPPLRLLGAAFEWLHNNVIRPAGNAIIGIFNGVIGALNRIPGVNIKKIQYLEAVGDAAKEIAEEMERRKEEISELYKRQKDRVRDELSAQISSIRQQYELGLISRGAYEQQAEKYQQAADDKLYGINKEMLRELDRISENTFAALPSQQQQKQVLGRTAGAAAGAGAAVRDCIESIEKRVANLIRFDSGTPFVPFDMPAMIHQGEGIIPKSFNEGLSNGDYALVGRDWPGGGGRGSPGRGGVAVNVSVTVEGSVIRERGLVEAIYGGISRGIESGELEPLPA